jgi:protein FAM50
MASYTGGAREAARILALEEARAARSRELARQKGAIAAAGAAGLARREFAAHKGTVEDLLASDTVGLVTHEDFKARRQYLERCAADEREKRSAKRRDEEATERQRKLRTGNKAKLSFASGEDSEDESDADASLSSDGGDDRLQANAKAQTKRQQVIQALATTAETVCVEEVGPRARCGGLREDVDKERAAKRPRVTKNPDANTDFLPDRDRELAEEEERERLKQEWHNEQEQRKNELVDITYSYWDGAGHRRTIRCKKGTTVGRFLSMVQAEFKELRNVSSDDLVFIKEDLIIPHHYSFYDFIVSKARGKSGPLFNFDVVEDVRLVSDAKKEKEDAHAAKVVERRWYERNRHIFPASRWVTFDPKQTYGKYTIHGS